MTRLLFLLTALLCYTTPSWGQPAEIEGRTVREVRITPRGIPSDNTFDTNSVLLSLKTTAGAPFSQDDFDYDLKLLSRNYYRVEPRVQPIDDNELVVLLEITLKPVIRSINWRGNEKLSTSALRKQLAIKPGTLFDRKAFSSAFNNVKAFYVQKGFFEAQLDYSLRTDPQNGSVEVDICIDEGRSGRIEKIEFIGFTKPEQKLLSNEILSKKYRFAFSWATGEGTYRREMVQQDELIVIDFLQNQGYADACVDIDVVESTKDNRIILRITAEKGPRYIFGNITLKGVSLFDEEELFGIMRAKPGGVFSPEVLRDDSQKISEHYGAAGHIETYASFVPHLDPEQAAYHVEITIHESEQYRVGAINIYGNICTEAKVILRESLLVPGDIFDTRKLRLTEQKLCAIDYFETVNVYAVRPSEAECPDSIFRDVNIEVEEKGTGSFSAFAGFSTMESVFGGINLTERNFNWCGIGSLWSCGFPALRGGGEYAHITASIGKNYNSYVFSWAKPWVFDTPWVVGFEGERSSNRVKARGFRVDAWGLKTYARYQLNPFLGVIAHYRFRLSDVEIPDYDIDDPLLDAQRNNSGLISGVGVALAYDDTNSARQPTQGLRSTLGLEYVGLGGNHTFGSASYLNTYYYEISPCHVLKFRADIRFIMPTSDTTLDTLPLDERFYLGGENTIRGFRAYSVSPKFRNGASRGGLTETLFSTEYVYMVHDRVDLFTYCDAGSVNEYAYKLGPTRVAVGAGVRLCVMESGPPVTIGYGVPINAISRSDEKRFFLSMGGRF